MILNTDCLDFMKQNVNGMTFDLIYMDPPYLTQRDFKDKNSDSGFKDSWKNNAEYYNYMMERLKYIPFLLKPTGSFLLHVDWRAVHYLKILCDDAFMNDAGYQGEIIWSYNSGGGSKKRYGRKHDTILWFTKSNSWYFDSDAARIPYSATIPKKYEHLYNEKGKVSGDVLNIPRPPNHSKEWNGWPTQKPLALLEFLVKVHCPEDGIVADFFCGSGTTLVAAKNLERQYFGTDLSERAVEISKKRLEEINTITFQSHSPN